MIGPAIPMLVALGSGGVAHASAPRDGAPRALVVEHDVMILAGQANAVWRTDVGWQAEQALTVVHGNLMIAAPQQGEEPTGAAHDSEPEGVWSTTERRPQAVPVERRGKGRTPV